MVYSISARLASPDANVRVEALLDAVRYNSLEVAEEIAALYKNDRIPAVRGRAAWALGRMRFRPAIRSLLAGVENKDADTRTWSAWALGEMGHWEAEGKLRRILDSEGRPEVRRAIFGAIRKLNLNHTREHYDAVARRLKPPVSNDISLTRRVRQLEGLTWPDDRDEIVRLRGEIKNTDSGFFTSYMEWVRKRPTIQSAIGDRRLVFGHPRRS